MRGEGVKEMLRGALKLGGLVFLGGTPQMLAQRNHLLEVAAKARQGGS